MKPFLHALMLLVAFVTSTQAAEMDGHRHTKAKLAHIDSAAASRLAIALANMRSKQDFGSTPFASARSILALSDGRWHWQAVSGYGHGDLLATVSFSRAGTRPAVQVSTLALDTLLEDLERGRSSWSSK